MQWQKREMLVMLMFAGFALYTVGAGLETRALPYYKIVQIIGIVWTLVAMAFVLADCIYISEDSPFYRNQWHRIESPRLELNVHPGWRIPPPKKPTSMLAPKKR